MKEGTKQMGNPVALEMLDSGVRARVRTGFHGTHAIEWSYPFESGLHLQKDKNGRVCLVALKDRDFTEFDPRYDREGPNLFCSEGDVLEILEVPVR
jgi:hypothetical protein